MNVVKLSAVVTRPFHEPVGLLYHGGALLYAVGGYALGWYGLCSANGWVNIAATLLLAHAMVIAAYLIHECGHNTVFRNNRHNVQLGRFLNWICGSCYGTFEDIRYKHFRHHLDNDDVVWFDYDRFWESHPVLARITQCLEYFYIPAHEILMHALLTVAPFVIPQRRAQGPRTVTVILVRGTVFAAVFWFYPRAALLYLLAYLLMLQVLRFMDSLQHDYGGNPILFEKNAASRYGGRENEQAHTFSNPLSLTHDCLNWLTLNFGFHNAHHYRPTVPWYRLPAWHREKIGSDPQRIIPLQTQLRIFHKYRVERVLHRGGDLDGRAAPMREAYLKAARAGEVYGGNAVSFLTSF